MKPVLGRTLQGKKVVSNSGLDLGFVHDAYFELDGSITSLVIKPEHEIKELKDYIDKHGLVNVPFESVKAVGRYVVVNFPFSK